LAPPEEAREDFMAFEKVAFFDPPVYFVRDNGAYST
jgi:hypothetical protein